MRYLFEIIILLLVLIMIRMRWRNIRKIAQIENEKERYRIEFEMMCQWSRNSLKQISLYNILAEKKINTVAIYGKGMVGRIIFHSLKDTPIKVLYFVDKNADDVLDDLLKTVRIENMKEEEKPDAIIVSLPYFYCNIKNELSTMYEDIKIFSIEGLVYKL